MRHVLGWMTVLMVCGMAAAVAAEAPGDTRLQEAQSAWDEAAKLKEAGNYSEALARAEQALALREAVLGSTHPDVASSLHMVGDLHRRKGNLAQAESLIQRALTLREAALGESHPEVAQSLNTLAIIHYTRGLYGRAEPLFQRALAIREAALDPHHRDVAQTLNNLANLYGVQGLYAQAEPLLQRALAIYEASLGNDHPRVGQMLNNLATLYWDQGLYARAEPLFQRSLAIYEAALGKEHPDVANLLSNLATLYWVQGLYSRVEPLHQRALAIREASLGKDHPDVAISLNNLALLYVDQGLYSQAEPLHLRALAIREAALGKSHPDVATSLNNLAILYKVQGLYGQAEPLYQRALAIGEAALGKDHPDVAISLNNLATLYVEQGLYGRAESLHRRALTLREAALGKSHYLVATSLTNLAAVYVQQGLYGRADPLQQRAISIAEATFGKSHPLVADLLTQRALLRLAQQRLPGTLPLLTRAFAISEQRLRQEGLDFSESRLASFLQYLRESEQYLYALLRAHPQDARVRRLVLGAVLLRKGRSVEETADISRTLYRSLGAKDRDTFERLRGLRTQLATLSLAGPGSLTPEAYRQRLEALAHQGDALEADLARRSALLRTRTALPPPADIVDRVAASLPKDGALVELIAYRDSPLVPTPGAPREQKPDALRYLALVLFPDATTRAVDLGPAEPIDSAASRLRNLLANSDATFEATAQELHRLAFQPLRPLLGKTRRLFLSPDGQLGLVPFAALHDGRGFLLDAFDFVYLTSGRQLLPRPQKIAPASSVFVLADPDFQASPRAVLQAQRSASLERFFSTSRADLSPSAWVSLPGTRQEAESIQRLLPQARLYLGAEATKERLLTLPTPGILHLATHGFFLEDAPIPKGSRAVGQFGALGDTPRGQYPREPLLRSGLVLAGAQAPAPDATLVTALELAGLDLWGTQLVVLSACDTGRGDVKLGQGIYGLRRALVVAGAETVVMSLWKVDDDTTRLLMEAYYRNLLAGQGRASALREAMRSVRVSRPHPHDWAPFIALGRDTPLRALE